MKKESIIFFGFLVEMSCFIFAGYFLGRMGGIVGYLMYLMYGILGMLIAAMVGNLIAKNAVEKSKIKKRSMKCKSQ